MDKIPLLAWLFQGIPESICLVYLSCRILGYRFEKKKYLLIFGLVQAILAYVLRLLLLVFGVHSIILVLALSIWTYIITRKNVIFSIISASTSFFMLSLFEFISYKFFIDILKVEASTILSNTWLRILAGWPQIILLYLTAVSISVITTKINLKKCKY